MDPLELSWGELKTEDLWEEEMLSDDYYSSHSDDEKEENVKSEYSDNYYNPSKTWDKITVKPRQFSFIENERLLIDIPKDQDGKINPFDIYKLFITDELLSMISLATNRHAEQVIKDKSVSQRSRMIVWKNTCPDEILKFIAIILYMGLVNKPEIALYWSKSIIYNETFVPKIMSRERFELLWRFIDFSDTTVKTNKKYSLHKVEPLLDHLLSKFQEVYEPGANMILERSMVPFREQYGYGEDVPYQYGIQIYKLCTPEAYTWNIIAHKHAAEPHFGHNFMESLSVKISEKVINKGRTLYGDKYFSSVSLVEYLLTNKTYYCGMISMSQKYIPDCVKMVKLNKGEMKGAENDKGVKFYNWCNKKCVLTITSLPEHGAEMASTGKKNRSGEDICKPPSIISYNKAKKGINVSDQFTSYHSVLKKSKKWCRKLAFELIGGTAVVNAHILHQKYSSDKLCLQKFTESLVLSIITGKPKEDLRCGKRTIDLKFSNSQSHTLGEAGGSKQKSRKRCKECYKRISRNEGFKVAVNKAKRVSTFCNECNGKPYLCLICFNYLHKKDN